MDSNQNNLVNIDTLIDSSLSVLMTVFENNDFDSIITLCEPSVGQSIFHSAMKSKISMLKAGLTLDKDDLAFANQSIEQTLDLCNRHRRKKVFCTLAVKFGNRNSCEKYTDIELHAELTYAMVVGCRAALELLQCHNLKNLAKIVYRISICMKSFKLCRTIYEKRTKWQSTKSRALFEAGISLERGFRHLIVSYLPPKLLKIINFLGYRGVREIAFQELDKTAFELKGIYSIIAELVLILYWLYIETHTSFGPNNTLFVRKLVDKKLKLYPNSLLYRAANAKLIQLNGAVDQAIDSYESIIHFDKQLFHKFAHFELMFINAVKCDWDQCIRYAELLRKHTLHSPAITTYIEAVFRYVKSLETNDPVLKQEAIDLFGIVPSLRIRYLGKTTTFEKAVVVYSEKFFQNNDFMLLPALEILYQLNYTCLLNGNKHLLQMWMSRVDREIENHSKYFVFGTNSDNYLTALFYKAIIYKHSDNTIEAQQFLKAVINQECRVVAKDRGLIPQTLLELALIEIKFNNREKAKQLLEKILKYNSKYTTENLVHIRVYAALRGLGFNTDKVSDVLHDEYEYNSVENHNKVE